MAPFVSPNPHSSPYFRGRVSNPQTGKARLVRKRSDILYRIQQTNMVGFKGNHWRVGGEEGVGEEKGWGGSGRFGGPDPNYASDPQLLKPFSLGGPFGGPLITRGVIIIFLVHKIFVRVHLP